MAYDPQKNHRRPAPAEEGPAPVDALIAEEPPMVADDPPAGPAVTPPAADPPPDALLLNTGLVAALGAIFTLLLARYLWRRRSLPVSGE